jgi:hypothetical protein
VDTIQARRANPLGRFAVARPCILANSDFSVTDRSRPWSSKTVRQHDLVVTLDFAIASPNGRLGHWEPASRKDGLR